MRTLRFLKKMRKGVPISKRHGWKSVLLFFALFGMVLQQVNAKDYEISVLDDVIKITNPAVSFKILMNDDDDNQAYWTSSPELYVDGNKVLNLSELGFLTGNNSSNKTFATKTKSVGSNYYVELSSWKEENYSIHYDKYWVEVKLYIANIDVDHTYKVTFKGKWQTNNVGGKQVDVDKSFEVKVQSGVFNTTADRSLTRPSNNTLQYNQKNLTNHEKFYYVISFYTDANYSNFWAKSTLPSGVTST